MTMNMEILFRKWGNIIKRMEAISRDSRSGYKLVTMTFMIDPAGEAQFWTEPQVVKLEPKSCRITDVLLMLTGIPQLLLTDDEPVDG